MLSPSQGIATTSSTGNLILDVSACPQRTAAQRLRPSGIQGTLPIEWRDVCNPRITTSPSTRTYDSLLETGECLGARPSRHNWKSLSKVPPDARGGPDRLMIHFSRLCRGPLSPGCLAGFSRERCARHGAVGSRHEQSGGRPARPGGEEAHGRQVQRSGQGAQRVGRLRAPPEIRGFRCRHAADIGGREKADVDCAPQTPMLFPMALVFTG